MRLLMVIACTSICGAFRDVEFIYFISLEDRGRGEGIVISSFVLKVSLVKGEIDVLG